MLKTDRKGTGFFSYLQGKTQEVAENAGENSRKQRRKQGRVAKNWRRVSKK